MALVQQGFPGADPAAPRTSRLMQMQARFQQKQLQEKEQKLLALYESQQQRAFQRVSRSSSLTSNGSSSNNNNNVNNNGGGGGGKVRQLFDERRKPQSNSAPTGWDRSYPLEPLRGKTHQGTAHAQQPPPQQRGRARPWSPPESPPPPACEDNLVFLKLPNVGGPLVAAAAAPPPAQEDRYKTYNASKSSSRNAAMASTRQPPLRRAEPRPSPPAAVNSTTTRRVSTPRSTVTSPQQSAAAKATSPVTPAAPATAKAPLAKRTSAPAPAASKARTPLRPVPSGPPRDDLVECRICGRNFANDRIQKHQEICQRTATKKRKVFDPVKQRVKGTEAEQFVKKLTAKGPTPKKQETKKPDWRKKHEEFIATIRAAKEFKAHIAAGGKVTDLPPPPPLDTSDYVQCPHCQRRFNEGAAERHIPRCANMQHNKPKPVANSAKGGALNRRR